MLTKSANGSRVVRSQRSMFISPDRREASAIPSSSNISHRATLSRLPCGSLRSALTGTRRDAPNYPERKEWQILTASDTS
jgi:hypothetical protein